MSERQSIALIGLIVLLAVVSFVACIGMVALEATNHVASAFAEIEWK